MSDPKSYFLDRKTRLDGLSDEKRNALMEASSHAEDPEAWLDQRFASWHIAKRHGFDVKKVRENFPSYAKAAGFEDTSPTAVYNTISNWYNQQKDNVVKPKYKRKGFQPVRTALAGHGENVIRMAGGLSAGAGTLTTGLDKGVDEQVQGMFNDLQALDPAAFHNYNTGMLLKGYVPSNIRMLDGEKKAKALEIIRAGGELGKGGIGQLQKERMDENAFWEFSDTVRQATKEVNEAYGVDEEFANSFMGQVFRGYGQLPSFIAANLIPGVGQMAIFGAMYEEALSDYEETVGRENFDPNEAMKSALPYAVIGTAMERFGINTLIDSIFKRGKKLTWQTALKEIGKAATAEGGTEAGQGFILDAIARANYDDDRELFTAEAFKKRGLEFAVGSLVSGTVSTGGQGYNLNKKRTLTENALRLGVNSPLSQEDFKVYKEHWKEDKVRQRIQDPTMQELFIRGMNGDMDAQNAYNAELVVKSPDFEADFEFGEGENKVIVGTWKGNKIVYDASGKSMRLNMDKEAHRNYLHHLEQAKAEEERIANLTDEERQELEAERERRKNLMGKRTKIVLMPDTGQPVPIGEAEATVKEDEEGGSYAIYDEDGGLIDRADTEEEAEKIALDWEMQEQDQLPIATEELAEFFRSMGRNVETHGKTKRTLKDEFEEGHISEKAAEEIIRSHGYTGDNVLGEMQNIFILGRDESGFVNNVWVDAAHIYNGATPFAVVEEMSEGYLKRMIHMDGEITLDQLREWKRQYEEFTGIVEYENTTRGMIEWFSNRSIDYVTMETLDGTQTMIPSSFKSFLIKLKLYLNHVMIRVDAMRKMKAEGKLDPELEMHLSRATLTDMRYVRDRIRRMEEEQINEELGRTEDNELMAHLRRISLPSPNSKAAKNGRLKVFRKKGDSLDDVRQRLNEEGFRFETVNDLLDAITASLENFHGYEGAHGVYPETDGQVDYSYMTAYHGTPHSFDRFSLDHIGSGEGAQAYGWGLYFAGNKEVAEWYRNQFAGRAKKYKGVTYEKDTDFATQLIKEGWDEQSAFQFASNVFFAGVRQAKSALEADVRISKKEIADSDSDFQKQVNQGVLDKVQRALDATNNLSEDANLYQVDLKPSEDEYLLWDKPLSEQSEKVREALYEYAVGNEDVLRELYSDGVTPELLGVTSQSNGGQIYNTILQREGDAVPISERQKNASMILKEYGIRGIKYLDGNSRGPDPIVAKVPEDSAYNPGKWVVESKNGKEYFETEADARAFADSQQNYNYVIFDDADVEIEQTFQIAPPVDSPAFARWFGDSKVVDENGEPLVVYHGTNEEFESFKLAEQDVRQSPAHRFIWFSKRADEPSSDFTADIFTSAYYGDSIYPVYLSIKNPYYGSVQDLHLDRIGPEELKEMGYDGFIDNLTGSGFMAVIDPTQIKSATGNVGTFDPNDPRITFQTVRKTLSEQTGIKPEDLYQSDQSATEPLDEAFHRLRKEQLQEILDRQPQAGRFTKVEEMDRSSDTYRKLNKVTDAVLAKRYLAPITSRLRRINPRLGSGLRKLERSINKRRQSDRMDVETYMKGTRRFSKEEKAEWILAVNNGDTATVNRINKKYGLEEEYEVVRKALKNIHDRAVKAGLEVGFRREYWPRIIKDLDGLQEFLYGDEEINGKIQEALMLAQANGPITQEDRIRIVNNLLIGYRPSGLNKPGNVKVRAIEELESGHLKFYHDPLHALNAYLDNMNEAIEVRKFFGKSAKMEELDQVNLDGSKDTVQKLDLDGSVGQMVLDLVESGKISYQQQEEVMSIYRSRFSYQATPKAWATARSLGYLTAMGQVSSAITQFGDFAWAGYEAGIFHTLAAASRATVGRSKITREDVGIELIAQEFSTMGRLNKTLDFVLTYSGLKYIDRVGKETLINASISRLQERAKAGVLSPRDSSRLNAIFGEEAPQVMADLAAGEINENILLLAHNILLDYQPVSLSEMPQVYLDNPRGRVFYQLKTFTVKQLDAFRREGIDEMAKGNVRRGITQLVKLMGFFYLANFPVDWIKDWLYGREPDMTDVMVDNLWKLGGLSRYNLYFARENPNFMAAAKIIMPPAPYIEYPLNDAFKAYDQISKGEDFEISKMESWKMVPWFGKFYYWHEGKGADKIEKKRQRKLRE